MVISLAFIETLVSAIVQAAPAIEAGVATAAPFIAEIKGLVDRGGTANEEDFLRLRALLDANSAIIQGAASPEAP